MMELHAEAHQRDVIGLLGVAAPALGIGLQPFELGRHRFGAHVAQGAHNPLVRELLPIGAEEVF